MYFDILYYLQLVPETFPIPEGFRGDTTTNVLSFSCEVFDTLDFNKREFSRQIPTNLPNTKFHVNRSSWSQNSTCGRQDMTN